MGQREINDPCLSPSLGSVAHGLQDPDDLEARVEAFLSSAAENISELSAEDFKVRCSPYTLCLMSSQLTGLGTCGPFGVPARKREIVSRGALWAAGW